MTVARSAARRPGNRIRLTCQLVRPIATIGRMGQAVAAAVAFRTTFDALHAPVYFAPETQQRLAAVGLKPGSMTYFASRAAAMGAVGPGTVTATFYSFSPSLIAHFVPRVWTLATPETVLEARVAAVDEIYRRLFGDETLASAEVAEAAALAREATEGCRPEGRPLYAAHADLAWPEQPHLALWHAITLLREHRGDGHVAALTTNGLHGLDALVTHSATKNGTPPDTAKRTRGWSDEEWDEAAARLVVDGILDAEGALTEQGLELRERVETATNTAANGPWRHLGEEKTARLEELCAPLSRRVIEAGAIPGAAFRA